MQFDIVYFSIAILIGFLLFYFIKPESQIILKEPKPDNVDNLLYIDDEDVCYRYSAEEINCPDDPSTEINLF